MVGVSLVAFIVMLALSPVVFQDFLVASFKPLIDRIVPSQSEPREETAGALAMLEKLQVKGRAPKTGYARSEFGNGWGKIQGCSVREVILYRDLTNTVMKNECQVQSGVLQDPYTGDEIVFSRNDASAVQIDHVVALSDAWQKGAQGISREQRTALANDPLNLLASDGPANQQKGDADAATWLPSNKSFRCHYIERQVAVKYRYSLWVTQSELDAMNQILARC